jgi:hypothetical protein
MVKFILISIFTVSIFANNNILHMGEKEKPSIENDFDENSYHYSSSDPVSAAIVTGINLLLEPKLLEKDKKKYNTDFEYLKKFEDKKRNKK